MVLGFSNGSRGKVDTKQIVYVFGFAVFLLAYFEFLLIWYTLLKVTFQPSKGGNV